MQEKEFNNSEIGTIFIYDDKRIKQLEIKISAKKMIIINDFMFDEFNNNDCTGAIVNIEKIRKDVLVNYKKTSKEIQDLFYILHKNKLKNSLFYHNFYSQVFRYYLKLNRKDMKNCLWPDNIEQHPWEIRRVNQRMFIIENIGIIQDFSIDMIYYNLYKENIINNNIYE